MTLINVNWRPSRRQLRQFGIACLAAFPLAAWIWGAGPRTIGWCASAGLLIAAVGLIVPSVLRPLYLLLMLAAAPIGVVVGELVMLAIYFGVFLPIGVLLRILKRQPLQLKLDPDAATYWQPTRQPREPASYYRQS